MDDLKQNLINKITLTTDEDLLLLLNEDYDFFTQAGNKDVTDQLSVEDKIELTNMVSEPFGYDTISQDELDEAISQWRMK